MIFRSVWVLNGKVIDEKTMQKCDSKSNNNLNVAKQAKIKINVLWLKRSRLRLVEN